MSGLMPILQSIQVLIIVVVSNFLWQYLSTYLKKKGENVATKEDIAAITAEIERVRQQYAEGLERLKASLDVSNRLRTSAVEKRLEKHQEAYVLWTELFWSLHNSEKLSKCIITCQDWWVKNSLYLSEEARSSFKKAYILANAFEALPKEDMDERHKLFSDIERAGDSIVRGAELPPLGEDETKKV
jgi:hypothetical protein